MKLIVGLGNPGREYAGTRHNVGYDVIDRLARRLGWIGSVEDFDRTARTRFHGLTLDGPTPIGADGSEKAMLLKPTTYMNLSGQSVQAAMAFHQMTPTDIMIVLDDLALPCGKIRIRPGGSSGGHNGLRDIERALGTNRYPRLRLGIDPPPPRVPGKAYVLGKYSEEQRELVEPAMDRACDAILAWIDKGIESAMSRFNAGLETKDQ